MEGQLTELAVPALEIPGFQLLELIGAGGMGTVYRALQISLQRAVAVKVLHAATPEHKLPLALQRESRLMASLRLLQHSE